MKIFMTGGTGFFGKSLFRHCAQLKQNEIVILSYESDEFLVEFPWVLKDKRIKIIRGDIRNFEFPEADFDYIYHGATTSGRIIADNEISSVIINGTKRVLDFAKKNKRLSKLLYVSSGAVYGRDCSVNIKEDFPREPVDIYGSSKLEAEKLCLESGVPCSIARCFSFVGEYLPLGVHFAIGNFISDCLNHRPIVIEGDGTPIRSYLYASDLTDWLWTILTHGEPGCAYNVGSDHMVSMRELAEIVRSVAGNKNEVQVSLPPSGKPPQRYVPNISRARNKLGLEVKTTLEEAICKTLEYHQCRGDKNEAY